MRILHTADWHLGKPLEGNSRKEEQQQFLAELVDIIKQQQVDIVVIAGDVFDSVNPPAEAEKMFYRVLQQMIDAGCSSVIAIAGNHDQPERMSAAWGLAQELGVFLIGLPNQCGKFMPDEDEKEKEDKRKIKLLACGNNWLQLQLTTTGEKAVFYSLPYVSEARLNQIFAESLHAESEMQATYSAHIGALWQQAMAECDRADSVQIGIGHLYTLGGVESGSERQIQLGGALSVSKEDLPPLQYIALGHLHGMQKVRGGEYPCYYSGSPLSYTFKEIRQEKGVLLVDVVPGKTAEITFLPLTAGYPLATYDFSDYEQALTWCENIENHQQWVNITISLTSPLTGVEIKTLRQAHPRLLEIRPLYLNVKKEKTAKVTLTDLSLTEKFCGFVQSQEGCLPEQALIDLFLSLVVAQENAIETAETAEEIDSTEEQITEE